MRYLFTISLVTLTAAFMGLSPAHGQDGQPPPNLAEALQQMQKMMQAANTNAAIQVVNFRALKALLPEEIEGLKRTSASGEKSGVMGMTVSFAEGVYETADGGRVTVKISDLGGMGGMMKMAQAGWAMAEIDRETDTGFERTTRFKGQKAHEKYDSKTKRGESGVMAYEKYHIEITGRDVPFETIEAVRDAISLEQLKDLKPDAPAAEGE
jgi:hypothetical protein